MGKFIEIEDKQKYLDENSPIESRRKITDKVKCIHCNMVFEVKDYLVYADHQFEFIVCP